MIQGKQFIRGGLIYLNVMLSFVCFINKKDEQYNGALSRKILASSFVLLTIFMSSNAIAYDVVFDKIRQTGYWYTSALIDYFNLDGCSSPISVNSTRYEAIFPSFSSAKRGLFNKQYKGGECEEYIYASVDKPEDWPLSERQWEEFQKQFPDLPKPMTIHYHCVRHQSETEDYFINFKLQPQYQCEDATCSEYRTACAGDVYAGDLLQFPLELLGHTGIIYTSDEVDPKKSYLIMEVLSTPPIIHTDISLSEVKNKRPVWGVRYGYGNLNDSGEMRYFETLKMLSLGLIQSQFCPIYTKQPIYKIGGYSDISITNPLNHQMKKLLTNHCAVFRCDTFIQYLYKTVLNVQLPPQNLLHMPKDLFNAFPNQRGDVASKVIVSMIENKPGKALHAKSSRTLFASYQDKNHSVFSRSDSLDSIEDLSPIGFKTLLKAIHTEEIDELKSQLLYLILEKAKKENMSKKDWRNLKSISLSALHDSFDPRVIVNALLLSEIILTPDEIITEIKCLLARMSNKFSDNDLMMINNAMNASLFHPMINSDSVKIHQDINAIISNFERDRVIESFSIHINEILKDKLSFSKKELHRYLANATPQYFHADDFPRNYFRASSWSTALLKTKSSHISPEKVFYAFLKKVDDKFVLSLLIVENKKYFTTPDMKLRLLRLFNKRELLNHNVSHPMEMAIVTEARLILSHDESPQ